MKKGLKVCLGVVGAIVGIIVVMVVVMIVNMGKAGKKVENVPVVELSEVKDGSYEGEAETPLVKVKLSVNVKDHKITDIKLIKHQNGKGKPAEKNISKMIEQNTSEVDAVSGATMSSKVISAAVRQALGIGVD